MRKYTKLLMAILLIAIVCVSTKVKADEKIVSGVPSSIPVARGSSTITYSGVEIWKKNFTIGGSEAKAICTRFNKPAPISATCKAVKWNSDPTKNRKIAVAMAAMIYKARSYTSGSSIGWEPYFYLEFAGNYLLYTYNGKNRDNNVSTIYNWGGISSNKMYKEILSAGITAYNNYGKTDVKLTNPKISLDGKTVNASVTLACYNTSGKITNCSAQLAKTLTIEGTDVNGNPVKELVSANYTKNSNGTYNLKYSKTFANDFAAGGNIKGSFYTKNTVTYKVVQNYNCGSSYQTFMPNEDYDLKLSNDEARAYANTSGISCSLNVTKVNEAGQSLSGAKFALYADSSLKEKVGFATSNSSGKLSFKGLDAGTYYLKEVAAPNGYVALDSSIQVELKSDVNNCIVDKTVQNKEATSNLLIKKIDGDNKAVVGAKIKVYTITTPDGAPVDDLEITEDNPSLNDGNGSEGSDDMSGEDSNASADNQEYNFNYLHFNENGDYDPKGSLDYFISTDSPKLISGLPVGQTYYIVEDSLPENSDYAGKVRFDAVYIEKGGETYTTELINIHSKVVISKQDITSHKELPGAELSIKDATDVTRYSWTSTDKPQEIVGLADGDYTLVETTAPNGYKVSETISFTIENGKLKDDDDNILVMYDSVVVNVPDTFTTQNIITMIAGLVLVVTGTGVLVYEFKKKKTA